MKINPEITKAIAGLSESQIAEVCTAAKSRFALSVKQGAELEQDYFFRCLVEYAAEVKAGRPLEIGMHPKAEVLFERDYRAWYASPRAE